MLEALKLYAQDYSYGRWSRLKQDSDSIKGFQLDGYVTICLLIAIRLILFRMLDLRFLTSQFSNVDCSRISSIRDAGC
jgi:hypothetical protein